MSPDDPEPVTAEWLAAAMQQHPEISVRARRVLELRYGIGGVACTDEEIARTFNISPERIHQIIAHSLSQLRSAP